MAMFLDVEHRMHFRYDGYIHQSWLELRLEPRSSPSQTLHSFYLAVGPPSSVARYLDWNANVVHHFGVPRYHDRIEVVARSLVEVSPLEIDLAALADPPEPERGPLLDFALFGGPVQRTARLEGLADEIPVPETAPLGEQIAAIGGLLRSRFEYRRGVTDYSSTTDHILEHGSGVCQDFAHLMLALLRLRGVPCRYVSGYLHVTREDGQPSESHAWVEVHCGDHGWVPFDPTHERVPDARYVTVARGRHYDDVPPNRGIYRGNAAETLVAEVRTTPSERRDVVGLHALVGEIDIPVYRELPRAASRIPENEPLEDPRQQQQQQQQ